LSVAPCKYGGERLSFAVDGGEAHGLLLENGDAVIEYLKVDDDFTREGRGSYLLRGIMREMALRDCKRLESFVFSSTAMQNRIRILGEENLDFRQGKHPLLPPCAANTPLPLTGSQAVDSLKRAEQFTKGYQKYSGSLPYTFSGSILTYVNLQDADVQKRIFSLPTTRLPKKTVINRILSVLRHEQLTD